MLPASQRLTRPIFEDTLKNKGLLVIYNKAGTLKYLPSEKPGLSVVTSSKHEKSAVRRNKIRRRIYTIFQKTHPAAIGVFYVSKTAYQFKYEEIKKYCTELFSKASQ